MKAFRVLITLALFFSFSSCEKDPPIEEDPSLSEGMGDWVEILTDNTYEAVTDGFLLGYSLELNQCADHRARIFVGSSADTLNLFWQAEQQMSFTLPIMKGSFYKVTVSVGSGCLVQYPKLSLRWMPQL